MPELKRRRPMPVEAVAVQLAPYVEAFEKSKHTDAQRAAFDQFLTAGLPTARDENWKFTNLAPLSKIAFEPAHAVDAARAQQILDSFPKGPRIVFLNGHRVVGDATYFGIEKLLNPGPFVALNAAFAADAAVVHVRGAQADPIHVIHIFLGGAHPQMAHPRNSFVFEPGAQGTIIESYVG